MLISWITIFYVVITFPAVRAYTREPTSHGFLLLQLQSASIRLLFFLVTFCLVVYGVEELLHQILIMVALNIFWAIIETCSHLCFRFFRLPLTRVLFHLPIRSTDDQSWSSSLAYVKGFFPLDLFTYHLVFVGLFWVLCLTAGLEGQNMIYMLTVGVGFVLIIRAVRLCTKPLVKIGEIESKFLATGQSVPSSRLKKSQRVIPEVQGGASKIEGKNVVLIINESVGANALSSQDKGKSLADRLVELAGDPDLWVIFENTLTASTCTDISIPCLITGCAPQKSADRLHLLPTIFDIAKLAGLKTVFATSCTLKWANFDQFFELNSIDRFLGPLEKNYPIVNELNCDDVLIVEDLCEYLIQTPEPVCAVVYLNSLHIPFQSESKVMFPAGMSDRRDRATYITEQSHKMIFDALEHSGRNSSSLLFTVGDHGELPQVSDQKLGDLSRLTQLSAPVIRPLCLMRIPPIVSTQDRQVLTTNSRALISLIDIVPTVLEFLGCKIPEKLRSDGLSLFHSIPAARVHFTLSVNEWRSWPRSAVAIACRDMCVCVDYQSAQYGCVDEYGLPFEGSRAIKKDELLQFALGEPIVRKAIGSVFLDKLKGGG